MSIESDVNHLATDIGRSTGSKGHVAAKEYLAERLSALSIEPYKDGRFEGFSTVDELDAALMKVLAQT